MSPRQARNPAVVFLGWLLMGIGGLTTVTAGACTAILGVPTILSSMSYPAGLPSTLLLVALIGGLPILIGIGIFLGGRAIAGPPRVRKLPPSRVEDFDDQP